MADYAVLYFDIRGRAEPIRLVLTAAGQAFDDRPIVRDLWPQTKLTTPLGQAPVLYELVGGEERMLPHSQAILRHLGRKHGLYGRNEDEATRCDVVAEQVYDARAGFVTVTAPGVRGKDPAALAAVFEKTLPPQLVRLEKIHSWGPGGLFVNDAPTWADCLAYDLLDTLQIVMPPVLEPYPGLRAFVAAMRAHPSMSAYLRERQRPSEMAPLRKVLETGQPL